MQTYEFQPNRIFGVNEELQNDQSSSGIPLSFFFDSNELPPCKYLKFKKGMLNFKFLRQLSQIVQ